jgi:hypothetical protein
MEWKIGLFEDPNGKFKIQVPENWRYQKKNGNNKDIYPCQFEINKNSSFQISCGKINDHIRGVIKANNLSFHDFDNPNLTYQETYNPNNKIHAYFWMRPIEDHFILAMYIFDPNEIGKELGLTLMEIRLLLQTLAYKRNDGNWWRANASTRADFNDFYKIEAWQESPKRFFKFLSSKDKSKVKRVAPVDVDVIKLYALLKLKISDQPNGFYSLLSVGRPLDNMIWWDFILESKKGFIQVWRTRHIIEAIYEFDDGDFDLIKFFNENIDSHIKPILETTKKFEKHTVYINHYKSYKECVRSLWTQIRKIDLSAPTGPINHISNKGEVEAYNKEVKKFIKNSIKFHTLGKSLVLNSAFQIETFLNLLIRVGCTQELKDFQEILDKYLRSEFMFRLRNLGFYVNVLASNVDTKHQAIKDANELMILRNKYVHFEEDTAYNKIGEVSFDSDFPLHTVSRDRPAIDTIKQIYHRPDFDTVKKAYETTNNFVNYIESLIHPYAKKSVLFILEQNPISYNESRGVYSSVFTPTSLDFFNIADKEEIDD